ncbi:unnamed protein product [Effrenium voratum]|uniref:Uncharacterized protein n=1 Tax=Effrenium voratum TaxID=2562239 RepID=A0AA36HVC2_9DINO|nr:unnamed protein product [Effrenium voratum]CAJ1420664.1 unnamed protein product [Effrenium voratum]CAJ1431516.1 unnamed protein product [Effrenium voratum]
MAGFRAAGSAALALLGFTLYQSFWSTGIVYGWPSLLNLLQSEGVYGGRCSGSESCPERVLAFNLVFSVGGATNVSGGVFCGFLVDCCGPKGGMLTGLVLILVGSLLLGLADVDNDWAWPLAYVFYGLGGCCVHLSSFSLGNAFGSRKGLVISMLVSVFSISSLAFQGFDLAYRAGLSRSAILMVHVGIEAVNIVLSGWLWPREAITPGAQLKFSGCRVVQDGAAEKTLHGKMAPRELCRHALRAVCTWKFGAFLAFHFSQLFLNRCLMGWMEAELRWKSDVLESSRGSGLNVEMHLAIFNTLQAAAGFIAIPFFGFLVARFGHRHAPFCATAALAVLYLSIRPLPYEWMLPVLYIVSAVHRQMFFSTFFTYVSSEYPPQFFATLSGMANVLAGLGTFLQNPWLEAVLRRGDFAAPLLLQAGFAVLVLLGTIIAWCNASRSKPSEPEVHEDAPALPETASGKMAISL